MSDQKTIILVRYPEHDKLKEYKSETQFAYDFKTFCESEGVWLSRSNGAPFYDFDKLLYKFIGVDPVKLEREKRAMLDISRKRTK